MSFIFLKRFKLDCLKYIFLILLTAYSFSVQSADLSEGLKEVKIGMTKAEVFSILKNREKELDGIFAPSCVRDQLGLGEECRTILSKLTYANFPIMGWFLNFSDESQRLAGIRIFLSKEGCVGTNNAIHPKEQFERLTNILKEHYGIAASRGDAMVWTDTKIKAGLVVSLVSEKLEGIAYPNCPVVSVYLVTEAHINKVNHLSVKRRAKEKDL